MLSMIAPGIDIPPGLEDAYYGAVRLLGGNNPNTIIEKRQSPARKNFSQVSNRSLFVKFKSTWRSFDTSRKNSWTLFWEILPFGNHGGLNGWPGSGYSAFVYVNAPRYKRGEPLLLDPPGNLIINGDFSDGDHNWLIENFSIVPPNLLKDFTDSNALGYNQDDAQAPIIKNHRYLFAVDVVGGSEYLSFAIEGGDPYYLFLNEDIFSDVDETLAFVFTAPVDSEFPVFTVYADNSWLGTVGNFRLYDLN